MLERLLPPVNPPVALIELADFLRLSQGFADDAAEYPVLDQALTAATAAIERVLACSLTRQRWRYTLHDWPAKQAASSSTLDLPQGPLLSVIGIDRQTPDQITPLPSDRWRILDRARARLMFIGGRPSLPPDGALIITYDAGFGDDWNAVPADLRQAILMLAGHYFENRLATDVEKLTPLPFGVASLLDPWRPIRL